MIKNWFPMMFNRFSAIRKAIKVRELCYRIGGGDVETYVISDCPWYKRPLWKCYHEAQSTIYNSNREISAIFYNLPWANTIQGSEVEASTYDDRIANVEAVNDWQPKLASKFEAYAKTSRIIRFCRRIGGGYVDSWCPERLSWFQRKVHNLYQENIGKCQIARQEIRDIYFRSPYAK